jgi:hypothetical protein
VSTIRAAVRVHDGAAVQLEVADGLAAALAGITLVEGGVPHAAQQQIIPDSIYLPDNISLWRALSLALARALSLSHSPEELGDGQASVGRAVGEARVGA